MLWSKKVLLLCSLAAMSALHLCKAHIASKLDLEITPKTRFLLYTRRNPEQPQQIYADVESLLRSTFYALEPIVLSIPRWQGNDSVPEHAFVVSAQLELQACNVITMDLSESTDESMAVQEVAELLTLLHQHFDVPLAKIQLVGFDAGAHLAGAVGQQLQSQLNQKLAHITALDPTKDTTLEHLLNASSAQFVEVIHTNGEGLGTLQQLGHIDYYPNGGLMQPGCENDANDCAHERVLKLAAEMWSMENHFLTAACSSVQAMSASSCQWSTLRMGEVGQWENVKHSGIYFLETRASAPYGKGAYYISFL